MSPAASPRKRFTLIGHSAVLDPAVHAVRDDLADVELADRVFAPHYTRAIAYRVVKAASVHAQPNAESKIIAEVDGGNVIDLFDISGGWAWVRVTTGIGYILSQLVTPA